MSFPRKYGLGELKCYAVTKSLRGSWVPHPTRSLSTPTSSRRLRRVRDLTSTKRDIWLPRRAGAGAVCRRPLLGSIGVVGGEPGPPTGVAPRRHRMVEPGKALLQGDVGGGCRSVKDRSDGCQVRNLTPCPDGYAADGGQGGWSVPLLHPPCQPSDGMGPMHQPASSAAAILILCGAGWPACWIVSAANQSGGGSRHHRPPRPTPRLTRPPAAASQ